MAGLSVDDAVLLAGPDLTDPGRAGGKAAALARLGEHLPVPAFIVIAPAAFTDAGLQAEAAETLTTELSRLGPGPFAVRSSGLEEDGAHAAHAGQFATELDVDIASVADAAHRVWRSGFSDSLADYRRARGLSATPQPPAVLVQQMVRARAAGVAFSADPVSGERHVVISAVTGLADRLVAGEVDGDQYWIDADGHARAPFIAGAAPVLTDAECTAVAGLARRAEAQSGVPQDIEWAFDETGLHLLQSRPVTTIELTSAGPTQSPDDGALTIWDNANIVESYPGVVSPLTFTFARHIYAHVYQSFSRLMGVKKTLVDEHRAVFENMLGRIDGRVYYNLLNWYRALALFPGFKANRSFMEGMMGAQALPDELAAAIAPPSDSRLERTWDRLRLVRVGLGLAWHQLRLGRTVDGFYARLDDALATPNAAIDAMPASALAAQYRSLEQKLLARWDAPLINDFLCMIAFGVSRATLQKWAGQAGLELHADMLIGQGDIVSAEPARLIREMGALAATQPQLAARLASGDAGVVSELPALESAYRHYIDKFGDRCTQELKLESLTLHDEPGPLLRAIAAAADTTASPGTRRVEAGQPTLATVFARRPVRRGLARLLMRWAKARVRDRENLRFERTRLFSRVRRIFLALGTRLAEAGLLCERRDVFNLTVDELLGAVEGAVSTEDLKALAALRQREADAFVTRPDPPQRIEVTGAHLVGVSHARSGGADAPDDDSATRSGLACCRGVVTARVRVIDDPRRDTLRSGEILVARHTDPGWIAAFAAAAGVIAERGSLLSHSAIVAREMGVPCVVAVQGVTTWLQTGDLVRLDGGAGHVTLVESAKTDG